MYLLLVKGDSVSVKGTDTLLLKVKEDIISLIPEVISALHADLTETQSLQARRLLAGSLVLVRAVVVLKRLLNLLLSRAVGILVPDRAAGLVEEAIPLAKEGSLVLGLLVVVVRTSLSIVGSPDLEGKNLLLHNLNSDSLGHS